MVEKDVRHPDFAKRLQAACDGNPHIPPLHFGRLPYFVDRFEEHGIHLAQESVRKWFAGETRPRHKTMTVLAKILESDELWLSAGKSLDFSEGQRRQNYIVAGGAVNVIAGFIQMHGNHPAFPQDDDAEARQRKINLYAIIRGARYSFHVTPLVGEGAKAHFLIPQEARDAIILGVASGDGLSVRAYELDWTSIEAVGQRKNIGFEVKLEDHPWREITSFAERI